MTKSVNLYLASGVCEGLGFWVVNFTEEDDIFNSFGSKLLECYRKELFGLEGAIEVKDAINTTLDILCLDSKYEKYKLDNYNIGYSFEIPINIIEDIFDLWASNYNNKILWKKYIGLLNLRKKIKKNNNYINMGLKGDIYKFSTKLDGLLSFKTVDFSSRSDKSNDLMW
ncbi:josephin [Prochlorococcus marinus]|uniref:josephin n=1 Tax=Prochlorococcus marinus TaxID=1219 RepID=UPI0022B58EA9|nr:josephin [Prochlorococcus marinus]